jgi:hypothetical protein
MMKTIILAALVTLSLGLSIATAEPANQPTPTQSGGTEYNLTAGAAGWG